MNKIKCPYDNDLCPNSGKTPYPPYCVNCDRFDLGIKLVDMDNKIEELTTTLTTLPNKRQKLCPNCNKEWDGVECYHCSFDTIFDPNGI